MNEYKVEFEYADAWSEWNWKKQTGYFYARSEYEARNKCVEVYGLGTDCDYRIVKITKQ